MFSPGSLAFAVGALPPLLVAVILHEVAHGAVAERLGDSTARSQGRISLNPLVHIDPVLTLLVPAILIFIGSPIIFGGAKPVPVNPLYFRNPRKGMVWVALAGPVTNFLLAGAALVLWGVLGLVPQILGILPPLIAALLLSWIFQSVLINIVLALFNLIPIPPLDGGRIAVGLLPARPALSLARVEPFGIFLVVFLLYLGVFDIIIRPVLETFTRIFFS